MGPHAMPWRTFLTVDLDNGGVEDMYTYVALMLAYIAEFRINDEYAFVRRIYKNEKQTCN